MRPQSHLPTIDSLRFQYTWQRHIAKKPTVAVWEKLHKATNADLRYYVKSRKAQARTIQQGELPL